MSKAAIARRTTASLHTAAVSQFLDAARSERGLTQNTLAAYRTDLTALGSWLSDRKVPIVHASPMDLQAFIDERVEAGAHASSMTRLVSTCRRFFQYLLREGLIKKDPTATIVRPKYRRPPPRALTEEEVDALLSTPKVTKPRDVRDRAMLEVLYATGMRVSELVNLRLGHIDLETGVVRIVGIGGRERLVPLSEEAILTLKKYYNVREEILLGRQSDYLFPTQREDRMTRQAFWYTLKRYARKAGIATELSPSTLRHAFATHLINQGADLRVVQMLLGNRGSSTAQTYRHAVRQRRKSVRA